MGHIREEQLALYAFGDLADCEVAAHVSGCVECQKTVDEFRESGRWLGAAFKEPKVEDLLEVRAAVLGRVKEKERRWVWWLSGTAAALLLLLPAIHTKRSTVPERKPDAVVAKAMVQQPVPNEHLASAVTPRVVVRPRHRDPGVGLRALTLLAGAGQPETLKMVTNDPNVVILWQLKDKVEE